MARSGTGVAAPCSGGSAIYFNPAGIVGSSTRWNAQVGATIISPRGSFVDDATGAVTDATPNNIPVPTLFATRQLNARWAIGLGVFVPYGLISEWPDTFEGRFLAYLADLKAVYVQPTVAVRLRDNLRLGGGLQMVFSSVELKQRVDLATQVASTTPTIVRFSDLGIPLGTEFADVHVQGSSRSAGGQLGILWEPTPRVSLGARYQFRQTADISGDARFTQLSTGLVTASPLTGIPIGTPIDSLVAPQFRGTALLTAQKGFARVPLPDQLVVGVAVKPRSNLTVLFDFQWVNWDRFEVLTLGFQRLGVRTQFEDYKETHGYRIGFDWQATSRVAVRGGSLYHTAAAPAQTVTPLLPEGERHEGTFGIGYQLSPRLRVDLAYQRIEQQDRRGRVTDAPRGPAGIAANTGLYTSTANLFGASLAFGF
jgi:long-chain fatty acid transport protein